MSVRRIVCGFLLLAVGYVLVAKAQNPEQATQERRVKAVHIMRLINTQEYNYLSSHQKQFASWQELFDSGLVSGGQLSLAAGPEVAPGFRLDIVVPADRSAYSVALHDTTDKKCAFSAFSDQVGLIYLGKVIDCPID